MLDSIYAYTLEPYAIAQDVWRGGLTWRHHLSERGVRVRVTVGIRLGLGLGIGLALGLQLGLG